MVINAVLALLFSSIAFVTTVDPCKTTSTELGSTPANFKTLATLLIKPSEGLVGVDAVLATLKILPFLFAITESVKVPPISVAI